MERKIIEEMDKEASSWFLNGDTDFMDFLHNRDRQLIDAIAEAVEKESKKYLKYWQTFPRRLNPFREGFDEAVKIIRSFKEVGL